MEKKVDTFIVTAYAKAPQNTAMYEVYRNIGVVLEIDWETRTVVDAEFTFITNLAQAYFRRLIIGYNMDAGVEMLLQQVDTNYYAPSVNSIGVALKSAFRRYEERVK